MDMQANDMLSNIMSSMIETLDNDRQKSESYKKTLESSDSLLDLLESLEFECTEQVLNVCDILEKQYGAKISNELFQFLLSVPYLSFILQKKIMKEYGNSLSVDKTFSLLSGKLEQLIQVSDKK